MGIVEFGLGELGLGYTKGQKDAIKAQEDAVQTQRDKLAYGESLMETYAMTASGNLIDNALAYASSLSRDTLIQRDMLQYKTEAIERDKAQQQALAQAGLEGSGIALQSVMASTNMDFANRNIIYSTADERIASAQMEFGMQLEGRRTENKNIITSAYDGISTQQTNLSSRVSAEDKTRSDRFNTAWQSAVGAGVQGLTVGSQLNDTIDGLFGTEGGLPTIAKNTGKKLYNTMTADASGNTSNVPIPDELRFRGVQ